MPEWTLKYADSRGEMHQQVAVAGSERELRERYAAQGFLVYSIKQRGEVAAVVSASRHSKKKLNLEKFLIFNQQFVTLIKAGLPILKSLDLLAERLTDAKLGPHIAAVRDEVRTGTILSEAFERQEIFPPMYVTTVMAGEKSGSLAEVLERYIAYQRLTLSVRKKILVSLIYPSVLIVMVIALMVFLITYVVPNFAQLYKSMNTELPEMTQVLIAVGTTGRSYVIAGAAALIGTVVALRLWFRTASGHEAWDRIKLRTPFVGEVWIKYEVAQFSRVFSTLLVGGIPLIQALETASRSLGSPVLEKALSSARKSVKEGQTLAASLVDTRIFPALSTDMIEVGESTGALPQMLNSVAEFFEEDVNTRIAAALSLIEPAIMIFMGIFVAFVLLALYLPMFSLADSAGRPGGI